ncbi:MAG: hypothetical protein AABW64_04480 [Nanoarchaeota archaeon]
MDVKKMYVWRLYFLMIFFSLFFFPAFVQAHGEEETQEQYLTDPVFYLTITAFWVVVLTIFIITNPKFTARWKKQLFLLMIIPIIATSLYLGTHTIYENINSVTKGPVHWHADYELYVCGKHFELVDPEGLRNKIGSPTFHEHNDDRIHIEGTVDRLEDFTLGAYFRTVGGRLTDEGIIFPAQQGTIAYKNGQLCPDEYRGTLNVYVNGKRIADHENYLIYPDAYVPPGDCIIITFDAGNQDTTNILCESWNAQGWNYDSFQRRTITIGEKTWQ